MTRSAFFSFHYDRDSWRVQQVTKIGAIQGQPLLNAQRWEEVKRRGDAAIKHWIAEQMARKSVVVVLVGTQTASRPWVRYEIAYAWDNKKPLVGVRIHGLADRNGHVDRPGANPLAGVNLRGGGTVADHVPLYTPQGTTTQVVYRNIAANLTTWTSNAYARS
jgi:hypothetical protein